MLSCFVNAFAQLSPAIFFSDDQARAGIQQLACICICDHRILTIHFTYLDFVVLLYALRNNIARQCNNNLINWPSLITGRIDFCCRGERGKRAAAAAEAAFRDPRGQRDRASVPRRRVW